MTQTTPNVRKTCKACRVTKPQSDFYTHPTSGAYPKCKACMIAARKAAYRADPEPTKTSAARSKARCKAGAAKHEQGQQLQAIQPTSRLTGDIKHSCTEKMSNRVICPK